MLMYPFIVSPRRVPEFSTTRLDFFLWSYTIVVITIGKDNLMGFRPHGTFSFCRRAVSPSHSYNAGEGETF